MALNETVFVILEDNALLKTTKLKPIVDAIKNRKKLTFYYSGPYKPRKDSVKRGKRIDVEGVALGLSKKGNLILRGWVDSPSVTKKGYNKTHWRTFMLSRMRNIEISNETFDAKRPDYKEGDDNSMSVTYVTTDWTKTKPVPKKVEPKPTKPKAAVKKPQPVQAEPVPSEPTPEPVSTELPQPSPETKPEPIQTTPIAEPEKTEPQPEALPQPKPETKPAANPEEDDEIQNLAESINKIKHLMFS